MSRRWVVVCLAGICLVSLVYQGRTAFRYTRVAARSDHRATPPAVGLEPGKGQISVSSSEETPSAPSTVDVRGVPISESEESSPDPSPPSPAWSGCIPNVVHFAKVDRGVKRFHFLHWVSAYAACRNLNASIVYHVDFVPQGSWWDLVTRLPCPVTVRTGVAALVWNETRSAKITVRKAQHISDFARTYTLLHEGGVFIDTDAVMLRPFPREVVCGRYGLVLGYQDEVKREVAVGVMASRPGDRSVALYYNRSKAVYDGQWSTHSVSLLSKMMARRRFNSTVAVLPQDAFYPFYRNIKALAGFSRKDVLSFSWCDTISFHYFASHKLLQDVYADLKYTAEPRAPCAVLRLSSVGSPIHSVSAAFVCDALNRGLMPRDWIVSCPKLVDIVCSANYSHFFPCHQPGLFQ